MTENCIYVINYGGLCDRINNLVNGTFLSEILKRRLVVYWPVNQSCHCRFDKLFENKFEMVHLPEQEFETSSEYTEMFGSKCIFYKKDWESLDIRSEEQSKFKIHSDFNKGRTLLTDIKGNQYGTLLQGSELSAFIPPKRRLDILERLHPVSEIREKIKHFCLKNHLDKTVIGMHIRKTDASNINEKYFVKKIEKIFSRFPDKKIFICSDSSDVEKKLKEKYESRLIINPKKNYPKKIDSSNGWITSSRGASKYNVLRSEDSVKEALIDLYLLAHTNFKGRSFGNFSNIGYYLSLIRDFGSGEKIDLLASIKVKYYSQYQRMLYFVEKIKS